MPLYLILAALIVVIDQAVKYFVRAGIPLNESVPFLPGLLDLSYVQNTGAAFSMLSKHTWVLAALSAVMSVIFLVALLKRSFPRRFGMLSMTFLLGGSVGNLIDRAGFGYVTDMFRTTFMDFPVFNVADIAIVLGAVFLCIDAIFFSRKKEET